MGKRLISNDTPSPSVPALLYNAVVGHDKWPDLHRDFLLSETIQAPLGPDSITSSDTVMIALVNVGSSQNNPVFTGVISLLSYRTGLSPYCSELLAFSESCNTTRVRQRLRYYDFMQVDARTRCVGPCSDYCKPPDFGESATRMEVVRAVLFASSEG